MEREWRYVPMTQKGEAYYLPKEDYKNEVFLKQCQSQLMNNELYLKFSIDDVLEICIPSEKIEDFTRRFGDRFKNKDYYHLTLLTDWG